MFKGGVRGGVRDMSSVSIGVGLLMGWAHLLYN